ncbi:hypothetical protein VPH35_136770 [Triticum aestivum]|uniref:Uncharacterized protein n=1 Tax=Aegilops tauschii subsp. strangulata TaxID=200361 RepID=A0A453RFZ6_AEGTS
MRATRSSGIQAKRPATLVTRLGDGMTSTRFGRLQPTRSSGIQAKHAAVPAATTTTSIQQRTGHYSVCLSRCPHLLPELIPAPSSLRARAGSKRRRGAANRDHEDSLKRDSTMTCLAVKTSV